MSNELNDCLEEIESNMELFRADAAKGLAGNKSAAIRSRVISSKIAKLFKTYRALSVKA